MESLFDNRVAKWIEALDRNFAQPDKPLDYTLWSGYRVPPRSSPGAV